MENIIKFYMGDNLRMIGHPILLLTGFSTVTYDLFSEYFIFLRQRTSIFYQSFKAHHDPLSLDQDSINLEGLMNQSFNTGKQILSDYICEYLNNNGLPFNIGELNFNRIEVTNLGAIFRQYLTLEQIQLVNINALSPLLRAYFQRADVNNV